MTSLRTAIDVEADSGLKGREEILATSLVDGDWDLYIVGVSY
jgi:hypothetical protein